MMYFMEQLQYCMLTTRERHTANKKSVSAEHVPVIAFLALLLL